MHQIGRRKTAAQCSLNHLNVVFQFMLGYYFCEVIRNGQESGNSGHD
nr:MAG TPA: hypothetical protein [Caudoviricetes sp.]DAL97585.1 MAG TPA: hypothetical protein [Caudoviricetes sp.]